MDLEEAKRFCQIGINKQFFGVEAVKESLATLRQRMSADPHVSIQAILVERGFLKPSQAMDILRDMVAGSVVSSAKPNRSMTQRTPAPPPMPEPEPEPEPVVEEEPEPEPEPEPVFEREPEPVSSANYSEYESPYDDMTLDAEQLSESMEMFALAEDAHEEPGPAPSPKSFEFPPEPEPEPPAREPEPEPEPEPPAAWSNPDEIDLPPLVERAGRDREPELGVDSDPAPVSAWGAPEPASEEPSGWAEPPETAPESRDAWGDSPTSFDEVEPEPPAIEEPSPFQPEEEFAIDAAPALEEPVEESPPIVPEPSDFETEPELEPPGFDDGIEELDEEFAPPPAAKPPDSQRVALSSIAAAPAAPGLAISAPAPRASDSNRLPAAPEQRSAPPAAAASAAASQRLAVAPPPVPPAPAVDARLPAPAAPGLAVAPPPVAAAPAAPGLAVARATQGSLLTADDFFRCLGMSFQKEKVLYTIFTFVLTAAAWASLSWLGREAGGRLWYVVGQALSLVFALVALLGLTGILARSAHRELDGGAPLGPREALFHLRSNWLSLLASPALFLFGLTVVVILSVGGLYLLGVVPYAGPVLFGLTTLLLFAVLLGGLVLGFLGLLVIPAAVAVEEKNAIETVRSVWRRVRARPVPLLFTEVLAFLFISVVAFALWTVIAIPFGVTGLLGSQIERTSSVQSPLRNPASDMVGEAVGNVIGSDAPAREEPSGFESICYSIGRGLFTLSLIAILASVLTVPYIFITVLQVPAYRALL